MERKEQEVRPRKRSQCAAEQAGNWFSLMEHHNVSFQWEAKALRPGPECFFVSRRLRLGGKSKREKGSGECPHRRFTPAPAESR